MVSRTEFLPINIDFLVCRSDTPALKQGTAQIFASLITKLAYCVVSNAFS